MNNPASGHLLFPIEQTAQRKFGKFAVDIRLEYFEVFSQQFRYFQTITNLTDGIAKKRYFDHRFQSSSTMLSTFSTPPA